jgi:hypothetical protein
MVAEGKRSATSTPSEAREQKSTPESPPTPQPPSASLHQGPPNTEEKGEKKGGKILT